MAQQAVPQARGAVSTGRVADLQGGESAEPPFDYWPITKRPRLEWPNGARVAFWVGMNIEHFDIDRPATSISTATIMHTPDPLNYGWRDYGPRVGIWRFMDVMDKYDMRASAPLNSDVCLHYPEIIEEGNRRRWVWLAHGRNNSYRWSNMSLEEERPALAQVISTIRQHTGQQPRGWLGPGLTETWNTPDLLAEQGVSYILDWNNDDQPYPMKIRQGRMISVPYSIEINDISLFVGKTVDGPTFLQIVKDQFDVLYADGAQRPRVMAIAVHPFIIGQPYRHKYLDQALEYITSHDGVWKTTSDEIADWYYQRYYDNAPA